MSKVENNKAWWLVLPVFLLVAFSAIIPLMTVVNYSVQDIFDADLLGGTKHRKHLCLSRLQVKNL